MTATSTTTATLTTTTPATTISAAGAVRPLRDRIARVILVICAAGAVMATASMAASVADADGALRVAETWQLAGLPVFAGLFVILAVGPRRTAGLWELVIANKLTLVAAGATYLSGIDGASEFVIVDGVLVALLIAAYVLTRGWTAWTTRGTRPPTRPTPHRHPSTP